MRGMYEFGREAAENAQLRAHFVLMAMEICDACGQVSCIKAMLPSYVHII